MITKTMIALVVEDDSSFREVVAFMLRRMGFKRVVMASDVEMAWEFLTRTQFDIVLSDWNMEPTMGIDLLRSVRADYVLAKMPFVLMTANLSLDYWHMAIEAGASDFLCKPFNLRQLQETVMMALPSANGPGKRLTAGSGRNPF